MAQLGLVTKILSKTRLVAMAAYIKESNGLLQSKVFDGSWALHWSFFSENTTLKIYLADIPAWLVVADNRQNNIIKVIICARAHPL